MASVVDVPVLFALVGIYLLGLGLSFLAYLISLAEHSYQKKRLSLSAMIYRNPHPKKKVSPQGKRVDPVMFTSSFILAHVQRCSLTMILTHRAIVQSTVFRA